MPSGSEYEAQLIRDFNRTMDNTEQWWADHHEHGFHSPSECEEVLVAATVQLDPEFEAQIIRDFTKVMKIFRISIPSEFTCQGSSYEQCSQRPSDD